jgi:hypothetical protein
MRTGKSAGKEGRQDKWRALGKSEPTWINDDARMTNDETLIEPFGAVSIIVASGSFAGARLHWRER